jgi:hypothetical protein
VRFERVGLKVQDFGFRAYGSGFRIQRSEVRGEK